MLVFDAEDDREFMEFEHLFGTTEIYLYIVGTINLQLTFSIGRDNKQTNRSFMYHIVLMAYLKKSEVK